MNQPQELIENPPPTRGTLIGLRYVAIKAYEEYARHENELNILEDIKAKYPLDLDPQEELQAVEKLKEELEDWRFILGTKERYLQLLSVRNSFLVPIIAGEIDRLSTVGQATIRPAVMLRQDIVDPPEYQVLDYNYSSLTSEEQGIHWLHLTARVEAIEKSTEMITTKIYAIQEEFSQKPNIKERHEVVKQIVSFRYDCYLLDKQISISSRMYDSLRDLKEMYNLEVDLDPIPMET